MYQAKIPAVTAEIERRIRRGIYDTKLPPVVSLQQEFSVARQTITDSVKLQHYFCQKQLHNNPIPRYSQQTSGFITACCLWRNAAWPISRYEFLNVS